MTDDFEALAELGGAAAIEMVASALADHGANAVKCPNCGAPMIGPYCAACGQERNTHRRSVRELGREFLGELASFDSRIFRTAIALVAEPGELSLAFQEGRPRRYVPALRLYLFVSLIFFLVLDVTGLAIIQLELVAKPEKIVTDANGKSYAITPDDSERLPIPGWKAKLPGPHYSVSTNIHLFERIGAVHNNLPAAARRNLDEERARNAKSATRNKTGNWIKDHILRTVVALQTNPAVVNGPLTTWIPRVLFILLPLFALLLAAFYWRQRKRFYFVDHLVFSLNMHSFLFVAILFTVGLAQIFSGGIVALVSVVAIGLYFLLSMKRFYRQNWFWTGAKFLAVSAVYTVFFLLPALGIVIFIGFLGL